MTKAVGMMINYEATNFRPDEDILKSKIKQKKNTCTACPCP